jgi:hypothetical protein
MGERDLLKWRGMSGIESDPPSTLANTTTVRVFKGDAALITRLAAESGRSVAAIFGRILADELRRATAPVIQVTSVSTPDPNLM